MSDLEARVAALKPCPFCGREPKLLDLAGWEVQCDCGVNLCLESPEQAAVIKAWNQRAELQKPALAFKHGSAERIALERLYNEEITVAKCIELLLEKT